MIHTTEVTCGGGGENPDWRDMFGPHQVDQLVRQSISMCWMALPRERRSLSAVEAEMRRLMERALRDMKEDAQAFGMGDQV
jgi:hypothetical protein